MKSLNSTYYIIFAFLISSIAIAQPAFQEEQTANYIAPRTVNLLADPGDYTGSPYHEEDFIKGSILLKGKVIAYNQDLRYNVSKEEFELRNPGNSKSKIVNTIVRNKNIEIEINDITFEYVSDSKNSIRGYFIPLFKGNSNTLLKKIKKEYLPAQKAINSISKDVPAMYREIEILYLVNNNGEFIELPSSRNGKMKAFGELKKTVKTYSKSNKLNVNNEKDLIQVVSYVDSL